MRPLAVQSAKVLLNRTFLGDPKKTLKEQMRVPDRAVQPSDVTLIESSPAIEAPFFITPD